MAMPWMAYQAIEWLENYLKPDMRVFEFGSGGSTLFFAFRVKEVYGVEHDQRWADKLNVEVSKHGLTNCHVSFCPSEKNIAYGDASNPEDYISTLYPNARFEAYAKTILQFPNDHFDLVSVDGVARPSCIYHALSKVKPSGCLLVDDSERKHYQTAFALMKGWMKTEFIGVAPTKIVDAYTSIWQKPR